MSEFTIDRESLQKDRIQLHYAIKPLASVSALLREVVPDFSHTALQWDDELGFVTQSLTSSHLSQPFSIALNPNSLALSLVVDRKKQESFELRDRYLSEAYDWLRKVLNELGIPAEILAPLTYFPVNSTGEISGGGRFTSQKLTSNLPDYYAIASKLLQDISLQEPEASPVHIWAHHFDIATLISFASDQESQTDGSKSGEGKSIGVGLSPGDHNYDQPYWYVTSYPYPEDKTNLPKLAGSGFWHTDEWVGAVLTTSQFGEPKSSSAEIRAFLDSAIAACKKILT
ncbi:MAG: hypothetical protein DCE90_06640 [Pseudanabaena sp.]|nr:MAG: hypothetical protein DCE90_06640 [Pseudanabaena sp.]